MKVSELKVNTNMQLMGKVIKITKLSDPETDLIHESDFKNGLKVGMKGIVSWVNISKINPEFSQLWADWGNGSNLALIHADEFVILDDQLSESIKYLREVGYDIEKHGNSYHVNDGDKLVTDANDEYIIQAANEWRNSEL